MDEVHVEIIPYMGSSWMHLDGNCTNDKLWPDVRRDKIEEELF